MKKILILLTLVAAATVAKAQVYLGGTLGVAVEHASYEGDSATSTAFAFTPEVGYSFNKTWAVGTTAGVQYQSVSDVGVTTVSILPYIRATFAHAGAFDFFGELALGYGYQSSDGSGANGFISALRPGFVAHLSDKFALVAKTTLLKYNHFEGVNNVGFALNGGIELGIQFTL